MKAFPTEHPIAGTMSHHADGMDLRDYFAAKVIDFALRDALFSITDIDEEITEATKFAYK